MVSDSANWGTVYVYYWSDSNKSMVSWPGVQGTASGTNEFGQKQFTISIPTDATYMILNNGSGTQTGDTAINFSATGFYVESGAIKSWT